MQIYEYILKVPNNLKIICLYADEEGGRDLETEGTEGVEGENEEGLVRFRVDTAFLTEEGATDDTNGMTDKGREIGVFDRGFSEGEKRAELGELGVGDLGEGATAVGVALEGGIHHVTKGKGAGG